MTPDSLIRVAGLGATPSPDWVISLIGICNELGRIVIPIELRRTMDIGKKDALEIFVDGDRIILKKYEQACIFCGNAENVVNYKGKNICDLCLNMLKETAK